VSAPHPPGIEIGLAHERDAFAIAALIRLAFESQCELYGDWTLPPMSETAESVHEAMRSGVVLTARAGDDIVGSVRGALRDGTVDVGRLVVHPDIQGQGIGRTLALAIEERFSDALRFEIFTGHLSEKSLGLYESLGYRRFKTVPASASHDLVFLEKLRR
jgi:GNAT superfamily N-acetyltransferase